MQFMNNLYAFKMEGKVKHDDAPDSMAQLCEFKYETMFSAAVIESPIYGESNDGKRCEELQTP